MPDSPRCGTCRYHHMPRWEDAKYGECLWPRRNLPASLRYMVRLSGMAPDEGTACPTWQARPAPLASAEDATDA